MAAEDIQTLLAEAKSLRDGGNFQAALEKAKAANALDPGNAEPVFAMAQLHRNLKDPKESVRLLRLLNDHIPNEASILTELAMSLWEAGQREEGYQSAKKAVAADGSYPFGWEVLGDIASKHGCWPKAVEAYDKLAGFFPDNPTIYRYKAQALMVMFHYREAAKAFQKVIDLEGMTAENAAQMGRIYFNGRMFETAVPYYEKAIEIDPEESESRLALARCRIQFGDLKEGERLAREAIAKKPDNIQAYTLLHEIKPDADTTNAVANLEKALQEDTLETPLEKAFTHVFLGRYYHGEKVYDKAFAHFKANNDLRFETYKENGVVYDKRFMEGNFAATKSVFSRENLANLKGAGSASEKPVFIVAMPRSGTTLLEQIIASHSQVFGAGELLGMGRIFFELNYKINEAPGADIHDIIRKNAKAWADLYLDLAGAPKGALRITDKMPVNFLHLGLIEAMFPNARVINIRRNPLDCCLSIYSNNFSESYAYSAKLDTLGHYYNLYIDLMEYWKKTLSLKFMEIRYEDLVENQLEKSKEVIEFCGLPWEEGVLEFYKGKKAAFTISQVQVSKPMNKGSMARWKPYEKFIQPLIEALDEDIVGPLGVEK